MEISFKHGNHVTILTIVKLLGKGAFGDVHLALDERGREFAIKKVKCNDINSYYNIAQELEMLTNLNNPNIIKMYSVDFIENNSVFIMEYCPDGSLNDRLDSSVPEFTQYMWMGQLTNALTYLHSEKIVHRDLKPENVLLKGEDTKLADFGIARKFYGMSQGRQIHDSNEYLSEYLDQMGTFAGTPYWVAPEVFDRCYNEKADIFSLGVIFYAIVTRDSFDFEDKTYYGAFTTHYRNRVGIGLAMFEQEHQIELDFKNKDDTKCNNNIIQMIRNMLRYDADKRPSAKECLKELGKNSIGESLENIPTEIQLADMITPTDDDLNNELTTPMYLGPSGTSKLPSIGPKPSPFPQTSAMDHHQPPNTPGQLSFPLEAYAYATPYQEPSIESDETDRCDEKDSFIKQDDDEDCSCTTLFTSCTTLFISCATWFTSCTTWSTSCIDVIAINCRECCGECCQDLKNCACCYCKKRMKNV